METRLEKCPASTKGYCYRRWEEVTVAILKDKNHQKECSYEKRNWGTGNHVRYAEGITRKGREGCDRQMKWTKWEIEINLCKKRITSTELNIKIHQFFPNIFVLAINVHRNAQVLHGHEWNGKWSIKHWLGGRGGQHDSDWEGNWSMWESIS